MPIRLKFVYYMMCPHYQEKEKHGILTDAYRSSVTHHQHYVFQDISVGNRSFFLLLSATGTFPSWSRLDWKLDYNALAHLLLSTAHQQDGS